MKLINQKFIWVDYSLYHWSESETSYFRPLTTSPLQSERAECLQQRVKTFWIQTNVNFFYSFSTEERISLFRCFIYLCNFILTEKLINISQEKQQILEKSQKQKKNSVQQKLSFFLTSLIFLWLFWPQDFLEAPQSLRCSQGAKWTGPRRCVVLSTAEMMKCDPGSSVVYLLSHWSRGKR